MNSMRFGGASTLAVATILSATAFGQNVVVTNNSNNPIPVREQRVAGSTPLQKTLAAFGSGFSTPLFVPVGRLAVIESVQTSSNCAVSEINLTIHNPKVPATDDVELAWGLPIPAAPALAKTVFTSSPVRLYLAPGATLRGWVQVPNPICTTGFILVGHWEEIPLDGINVGPRN